MGNFIPERLGRTWNSRFAYKVAGSRDRKGYITIGILGREYKAHRLAWLYEFGKFPENEIDHINHIKNDNRIINLRDVTSSGNNRNLTISKRNTSGHTGVNWKKDKLKWRAYIRHNGRMLHLGHFSSKTLAIEAREDAEIKYGYHANHGK